MKKTLFIIACLSMSLNVPAQSFLNKLKKGLNEANKAMSTVNEVLSPQATAQQKASGKQDVAQNQTQSAVNKNAAEWNEWFDLNVVSCVGDAASKEVLITVTAMTKQAKKLSLSGNQADVAMDATGTQFSVCPLNEKSTGSREMFEGLPVRYELLVSDVPSSLSELALVSFAYYAIGKDKNNGSNMSNVPPVQLRNLPINWTPQPAENIIAATYMLKAVCDLNIVSCIGDKKTGAVTLTLSSTTKSANAHLSLGENSGELSCYDAAGNELKAKIIGEYGSYSKDLSNVVPTQWNFKLTGLAVGTPSIFMVKVPFYANDHANDLHIGSNMHNVPPVLLKNVSVVWK